jgi:hypothetical protein
MSLPPWRTARRILGLLGLIVLILGGARPTSATPLDSTEFDAGTAAFPVQFGETEVIHRLMAVTVMPDSTVRVAAQPGVQRGGYRLDAAPPLAARRAGPSWTLTAPSAPGLYPVVITDTTSGARVQLQVFVLSPWDHEGRRLNGYRIGRYEREPRNGRPVYEPPEGFVAVTAANKDALVSPNFRLDQFLCKQTDGTPQYALVRPRLLRHLERVLAAVNDRGHDVSTLHVMSGYRTPYYNRAIGNTTEYSRHLYGDAADIYVDADGDRWMDDLSGDGRTTRADAELLAGIVRSLPTPGDDRFEGGLSSYGATAAHGPFVHLDLRGRRARW